MFEKTLSDLVRGIRAHRGTEVCNRNCSSLFSVALSLLWLCDGYH